MCLFASLNITNTFKPRAQKVCFTVCCLHNIYVLRLRAELVLICGNVSVYTREYKRKEISLAKRRHSVSSWTGAPCCHVSRTRALLTADSQNDWIAELRGDQEIRILYKYKILQIKDFKLQITTKFTYYISVKKSKI